MTLIVSLRIPDGIVIAGDSLSTVQQQLQVEGEVDIVCDDCGHEQTELVEKGIQANVPATTFSYSQKVFPFMDGRFGVGTYGQGQLAGRTVHFAVRELEKKLNEEGVEVDGVTDAADAIGDHAQDLLRSEIEGYDELPDDWRPLGFQIVGYDESEPKSVILSVGKTKQFQEFSDLGCTQAPQNPVVDSLWQLYSNRPRDKAAFSAFSLQDAIDYAEFLIGTVASYQRFSRRIPNVGGDIDVGLVTPFDDFQWIKQKDLAQTLEW